ncbi:uncharacterized protein [Littorina saxatilis]|uniref:C2H2-type domain-containing protein n=1 Tax=Littorina saxatilis TaxID=31220 RepID=A0AAN9G5B4_9CAEN
MDSPVTASLTPDPSGANTVDMDDKCEELMAATHRAHTFEGLLSLPVHFAAHSAVSSSPEPMGEVDLQRNSIDVHPLVLERGVFEKWRQFGSNNGLTTDSHIATYLLHHFETSHSLTRCVNCQAMLPLYCPKCMLQPALGLTLNSAPSVNPIIMATAGAASRDDSNMSLSNSLATSLTSFVMGAGHTMDLTTTSLADLQTSHLAVPQTFAAPELKHCLDNLNMSVSTTASASSPKKDKLCNNKKKKVKKGKMGKLRQEAYTCKECGTHIAPKPKPPSTAKRKRAAGVQPYRCVDCQQAFPYRRLFEDHLFSKELGGTLNCRHCHAVVLNPGDIRKHALRHTADMPYKCSQCPLAFSLACNLKTHLRTHSGEKPFPCGVCGRAFTQSIALKVHIRKHTGEKPFKCPHCPMAFAASSNLSRHVLKHTGQRPYRCAFCSAAFTQPGSLKTHTRSKHTGERPYVCEHCSAAFSDHSTLWKHRRNNSCHSNSAANTARNKKQVPTPVPPPLPTPSLLPQTSIDSPLPQGVAPQVQAVVVSQGPALQLTAPVTSVTPQQLSNMSMTVLSAAAAVVSQQQVYRQQQHLQLQQPVQTQQQLQQEQQQVQIQQQQPATLEGATFVNGVGWCFPIHQLEMPADN